jgi:hypothetical protein
MIVISLRIALFIHLRSFLEAMCRHAKGRKSSNIMAEPVLLARSGHLLSFGGACASYRVS